MKPVIPKNSKLYRIAFNISGNILFQINNLIIFFFGRKWNISVIYEFPKCGGTWLKRMLCDYYDLDFRKGNREKGLVEKLVGRNSIVQRHKFKNHHRFAKTIILIRDPRDAYNSFYYHTMYYRKNKRIGNLISFTPNKNDSEHIQRFIELIHSNPSIHTPGFTFRKFWEEIKLLNNVEIIKYEDLREEGSKTLSKCINFINGEADVTKINQSIEKFSFSNMTKRKVGEEEKGNHVRKGVIGDWKNNFNDETIKFMEKEYSQTLQEMGYKL